MSHNNPPVRNAVIAVLKARSQHEPKPHDPQHPYALKFIGCGHGVLFVNECVDCEIVGLIDEYKRAVKTVARVRDRLRVLGAPMPGQTSLPSNT